MKYIIIILLLGLISYQIFAFEWVPIPNVKGGYTKCEILFHDSEIEYEDFKPDKIDLLMIYDSIGKKVEEVYFDSTGKRILDFIYHRDDVFTNKEKKTKITLNYQFDFNNKLSRVEFSSDQDNNCGEGLYSYDSSDNLVFGIGLRENKITGCAYYQYNEKENLSFEYHFDSKNKLIKRLKYEYDISNKLDERTEYGNSWNPESGHFLLEKITKFVYDENGLLKEEQLFNNEEDGMVGHIKYYYDEFGNIKHKIFQYKHHELIIHSCFYSK